MGKKKVIFVEPMGSKFNIFAKTMSIPLLGTVYLGTIAKQAGYPVMIINENVLKRKITANELRSADILCISCITTTIKRGKEIAKQFKSLNPKGKTIIGGIHASMAPNDVINCFDQVVVGEAEEIILDVLSGKNKEKIVHGKRLEDLDTLPLPDFRLIKGWKRINTFPVMTSRGCPYACNFCSVTGMFGRGYRMQSPKRVMEEILRYKKGNVFFSDDHFVANEKRTNELLDLMIHHRFDRQWIAQVRTEISKNKKLVAKMKKAGCVAVCIGFESINAQSLNDMNKGQTVDDIKRSIKVFHDNHIGVHGMFILGNDSDTKETFKKTADFCKETKLDYVQYTALTPLPGTDFYKKLEIEKRILHSDWSYYDGLHVVFKPKNMTAAELQYGLMRCFSDFYNYTHAIKDSLKKIKERIIASVKNIYSKASFPSFFPPFTKFFGKGVIRDWIKANMPYLKYIKRVSAVNPM
jgi:radical SAM superfamily enzyme YgiQ (UPF0313 family)